MSSAPFSVAGRVALVMGGGRGIGRACGEALAAAGADVALASRTRAEVALVADVVRSSGRRAEIFELDATDVEAVRRVVGEVEEAFGRIDILVNSIGMNIQASVLDVTEADWDQIVSTNLKAPFFCAQAVGRGMVSRGSGKIINVASTFAQLGWPGRAAYAASKGGVMQFTRVMAVEWGARGVNVNAVGPTAILTKMNQELFEDPDYRDRVLSRIPAGRFAVPDDVAAAVLFLASPASDMINGHLLLVDGGWSAI